MRSSSSVSSFVIALSTIGLCAAALGGCTIVTNAESKSDAGPQEGTSDTAPGPGTPKSIKITGAKAGGDFKMSGRLGIGEGKLTVTLAAIRDPDAPTKPANAATVKFDVSSSEKTWSCSINQVSSSGAKAAVDLAFINDTTGSMSGTVNGISDSVQKFAEDVSAAGVDAKFSMYTYGDAFATKPKADTKFTVGKADFEPPSFDATPRPYVGLTDVTEFKAFLTEMRGSGALGVGGGDGPENTIGALAYAHKKLAWRDGAARMFIAIGDNPSHQKGSSTSIVDPFVGPTGDELIAALDGDAVIHVVGNDTGAAPYYNLKSLADKTGGAFIKLPSDGKVDLGALNLKDWLTSSFNGTCLDPHGGKYSITIKATITGTKVYVGTLTFDVAVS